MITNWILRLLGGSSLLLLAPLFTSAQTIPTPAADDLWDISQGTIVTSISPTQSTDYIGPDIFDGVQLSGSGETGNVLFKHGLPIDTVHSVEWKTATPITLEEFRVFAWHRVTRPANSPCPFPDARAQGFRTFRLLAKNAAGDFDLIYEFDPPMVNDRYQNNISFTQPTRNQPFLYQAQLDSPVYAQEWRAEFVQFGDPNDLTTCSTWRNDTGPRVVELDGFGSLEPPEPDPIPTPEPTPTPTPEPEPVVIVPGLVGSHNRECILYDHCAPGVGTWDFTPTVDWYDPLIARLEAEGYEQGKDLFVAFYDWRQSNIESAVEYLVPTIDQALAASGAEKVDIVAHSMGGLVARAYAQSGPQYRGDIDQLIMLGTPNEGAADAYTVWESGDLPERWGFGSKQWISRIERALKDTRNQRLSRPSSVRSFFPSLAELVPINPFVSRENQLLGSDQLKLGGNLFLEALQNTTEELNEVDVLTIAGTGSMTLDKVLIVHDRTQEDLALDRWRDGHANPDPSQPDSSFGDQTVLASSANAIGSTAEITNALHDELPAKSQNLVINALVENPTSQEIPFTLASSGLSVDVMSPLMPVIHGPNGEILSATENTFEHALFDWDPTDPNGIKMLTISNPPQGEYMVTYTGTGDGDYTIATTFTDEDSTASTERTGTTTEGQQGSFEVTINEESLIVPPEDLVLIATRLKDSLKNLKEQGLIDSKAFGKLNGTAGHLQGKAKSYEDKVQQYGAENVEAQKKWTELQQALTKFIEELEKQHENALLSIEAILLINQHTQQLQGAGL